MFKFPNYTPEQLKLLKDEADKHEALVEASQAEYAKTGDESVFEKCTASANAYKDLCDNQYDIATKGA